MAKPRKGELSPIQQRAAALLKERESIYVGETTDAAGRFRIKAETLQALERAGLCTIVMEGVARRRTPAHETNGGPPAGG